MHHRIDAVGREALVHYQGQLINAQTKKIRQVLTDKVEGQVENQKHHAEKYRQGRILAREHLVHLHRTAVLLALVALNHTDLHHILNEAVAHIRQSGIAVQPALVLHLHDAVLQQLLFVLIQLKLPQDVFIALNELRSSKSRRDVRLVGVVLDHMHHRVDAPMHRRLLRAEVVYLGQGLCAGGVYCLIQQLRHTLALHRTDGHHRNAQAVAQLLHIYGPAVGADLIHHVQGQHHRHPQLQQLQCQIEISLNIGSIHDVDDPVGLSLENKVPGHDLLLGVGAQGVDTRQIYHRAALAVLNLTDLLIHRHAGEITHMLVGAGKGVKKRGLAAILIACQRKDHAFTSST